MSSVQEYFRTQIVRFSWGPDELGERPDAGLWNTVLRTWRRLIRMETTVNPENGSGLKLNHFQEIKAIER